MSNTIKIYTDGSCLTVGHTGHFFNWIERNSHKLQAQADKLARAQAERT